MHRVSKVVAIVAFALSSAAWADDPSASNSAANEPESSGDAASSTESGHGSYEPGPTSDGETGSGAAANARGDDEQSNEGNFSSGPTYDTDHTAE